MLASMRNCSDICSSSVSEDGAFDEAGQHFLDRADATFQPTVAGSIDGAHAALTDKLQDFVASAEVRRPVRGFAALRSGSGECRSAPTHFCRCAFLV